MVCACLAAGGALLDEPPSREPESPIKDDEEVVFFPTFGHLAEDGDTWLVALHGWIYEPESDSLKRRAALSAFRRFLGLDERAAQTTIFEERARTFLVDNERGKPIYIRLGEEIYALGPSGANGHFEGSLHLLPEMIDPLLRAQAAKDCWLRFEVVTREGDPRTFAGSVQLIGQTGLSVISDIDDTIKVSGVMDHEVLLVNTFLREFEAVPGMAGVYATWAAAGARFHYVSASPWQLYTAQSAFVRSAGFPAGSFHLKRFRWQDSSVSNLFASPLVLKLNAIEPILSAFPQRRFVLVGDSGEKDPEVYGTLARRHPQQVVRIIIRDVTGERADAARFQKAFAGVPQERWTIFRKAEELDRNLP
jgi:hypothetical protein